MAKAKKIEPTYPKVIEAGFIEPWFSSIRLTPMAMNGGVNVRKFKVTIEMIDEPIEVIQNRIQDLWDKCDNYNNCTPLKNEAKKYGYDLKGDAGNKRRPIKY